MEKNVFPLSRTRSNVRTFYNTQKTINLFLTFLFIIGSASIAEAQQLTVVYANPGNGSITIPDSATNVQADAWGGGGGGGGVHSGGGYQSNGGGGGGGAYVSKAYQGGITLSLKTGAGGAGGSDDADGSSGSASIIDNTVIAGGGAGGTRNHDGPATTTVHGMGGIGGTATGGDNNVNGGTGYNYNANPASSGGGSPGGGDITGLPSNDDNAIPGNFPGGGGSGAREKSSPFWWSTKQGAAGANGLVRVVFTLPTNMLTITSNTCEGEDLVFSITNYQSHADITYTLLKGNIQINTFGGSTYTMSNATASANNGDYTVVTSYNFTNGHLQTGGSVSGSTTITSNPVSVIVNPNPVIANKSYTICSGNVFALSTAGSDVVPAGTTYTWTVSNNDSISGQSDMNTASSTVSQTLANYTDADQTIVYTVTPKAGSCEGSSFTVTVNVHPAPGVSISSDALCAEDEMILSFTGNPDFILDYTIDQQNGGTNQMPSSLNLPTAFGETMTGGTWDGSSKTATIKPGMPGIFTFKLIKITDRDGCKTEKP